MTIGLSARSQAANISPHWIQPVQSYNAIAKLQFKMRRVRSTATKAVRETVKCIK